MPGGVSVSVQRAVRPCPALKSMTTGRLCPAVAPTVFLLLVLLVSYETAAEQEPVRAREGQWHPVWPVSGIVWPAGSGQRLSPVLTTGEATP